MDIQHACYNLDILYDDIEDIPEFTLIKQYRKLSRLYHPDKNKALDAQQKFQEIHDSYEYLGKYLGYIDEDFYEDESIQENNKKCSWNLFTYKNQVLDFLDVTLGDDIIKQIQDRLLDKFLHNERITNYLGKIDNVQLLKIHQYLSDNKEKFNISEDFLYSLETIINQVDLIRAAN